MPSDFSVTTGFYWSQATGLISLGQIYPNYNQTPLVISESGVVAGASVDGQIFRWTPTGGFTYLGTPPAGNYPAISGINSRGDIVGNTGVQAFFVAGNSTTMTVLTSPDSRPGEIVIKAINDSGIAVGYYAMAPYDSTGSGDWVFARYAFKWDSSTPPNAANIVNLGSLSTTGARWSEANGINNNGVIVGYSTVTNPPFVYDAFTYQGSGPMVALQRLPGVDWHAAAGITDDGVVVGFANSQGTIWENGVPRTFTPSFAPNYNTLFLKGHTLAGTGQDATGAFHAWTLALPSAPACPGLYFTDSLAGPTSPCLAALPTGKYAYTASGVQRIQGNAETDRPMVTTESAAYLTATDFTADVTVTLVNNDLLYFGLGRNDTDPSYFNEPANGFYFRVHSGWQGNYSIQADVMNAGSSTFVVNQVGTYSLGSTITLRIVRAGDNVTMSVVGGGSVTYSLSAYPSLGLTNSNTRVFFGNTTVGSVFSDLKIYPNAVDTTAPVISGPGNITKEATGPNGAVATFSATATDNVDATVSVTATPASGSTFPLGDTTVTLSAIDAAGNPASATFTVTVRDTTAPAVTAPANVTAEATSPLGAVVAFNNATATDIVGVTFGPSCSPASSSTFALGTTTVRCSATDAKGNIGEAFFTVTVRDTIAPTVTAPGNVTAEATSAAGAVATYGAAVATDAVGVVSLTYSQASGTTFPLGTTTVTVTATDAAGHASSAPFTITVRDTTPPVITSLSTNAPTLWPPNHKMVAVTVSVTTSDAVSGVTTRIISATSNEPDNGLGDGDTAGDTAITGAMTLNLRAERSGKGNGRTYTITVEARDAAGNASTKTCTVFVPKSQGGK